MKELRNEETEMSKFLKLIVDLVIICTILIAAALLVPPLAGVKTVMNDNSTAETNLPVGSVAYGKQTDAVNLKKGQKIVYTKNNQAYVYEISDVSDAENDTYLVKDAYDKKTEERSVELSGDVIKLSFVVPLIAYAAIAVQSKEGLILIGLGIVFLIILFILAELWRKDKKDMEETKSESEEKNNIEEKVIPLESKRSEEPTNEKQEEAQPETAKEYESVQKTENIQTEFEQNPKSDENSYLQDAVEMSKEGTVVPADEKEIAGEKTQVLKPELLKSELLRTGETVEEPAVEETAEKERVAEQVEETQEESAGEALVSTEEPKTEEIEPKENEDTIGLEAKIEEALNAEIVKMKSEGSEAVHGEETSESEEEPKAEEVVEEVLPSPSVEDLLRNAQAHGDHPEVIEDSDNKVTLLDYTNLF